MQAKWKNLRTCFESESERVWCSEKYAFRIRSKSRRKYLFFDQMLLLKDSVDSRETSSNLQQLNSPSNNTDTEEIVDQQESEYAKTKKRRSTKINIFFFYCSLLSTKSMKIRNLLLIVKLWTFWDVSVYQKMFQFKVPVCNIIFPIFQHNFKIIIRFIKVHHVQQIKIWFHLERSNLGVNFECFLSLFIPRSVDVL